MKKSKAKTIESSTATEPEGTLENTRRAAGNLPSGARPDPEVIALSKRRQFSGSDKRRILEDADRCTQPGEIGALLRKEGIYSSHLNTWRRQRTAAEQAALEPKQRGRKADPAQAETRRVLLLTQENDRLRRQLAQANAIIEVQKKLCALLGLPADGMPGECC